MDAEKDVQDFGLKNLYFQKLRQIAAEKILKVHAAGADKEQSLGEERICKCREARVCSDIYSIHPTKLLKSIKVFTQIYQQFYSNLLPPHHLVHDSHITLDNLHDLRGDILIDIIRNRNPVTAISAEFDCDVNCLQQTLSTPRAPF